MGHTHVGHRMLQTTGALDSTHATAQGERPFSAAEVWVAREFAPRHESSQVFGSTHTQSTVHTQSTMHTQGTVHSCTSSRTFTAISASNLSPPALPVLAPPSPTPPAPADAAAVTALLLETVVAASGFTDRTEAEAWGTPLQGAGVGRDSETGLGLCCAVRVRVSRGVWEQAACFFL